MPSILTAKVTILQQLEMVSDMFYLVTYPFSLVVTIVAFSLLKQFTIYLFSFHQVRAAVGIIQRSAATTVANAWSLTQNFLIAERSGVEIVKASMRPILDALWRFQRAWGMGYAREVHIILRSVLGMGATASNSIENTQNAMLSFHF